jgi:hypothetical protein
MKQLFFLFILSGGLCAVILAGNFLSSRVSVSEELVNKLNSNQKLAVAAAIITIIVSLFNLFYVSGGQIVFIGNLLPSLVTLLMGAVILYDAGRTKWPKEGEMGKFEGFFRNAFVEHKTALGVIGLLFIVVHFFFEGVNLL